MIKGTSLSAALCCRRKKRSWCEAVQSKRLTPRQIIQTVRKSVRAILDLDPKHQAQGSLNLSLIRFVSPFFRWVGEEEGGAQCIPYMPHNPTTPFAPPLTHRLFQYQICNTILKLMLLHLVIAAYSKSLRLTFISAIAMFVFVNALVLFIKLPRLRKRNASS